MDSIGTIGGIFELIFGVLLMVYAKIRKSLYYHSIISELHAVNKDQNDDKKSSKVSHQLNNADLRDESKIMDHENNRLINYKANYNSENRLSQYIQDQIEQIRMRGLSLRQSEINTK